MKVTKSRDLMTIDERIREAGWFIGAEKDWWVLPAEKRDELAFKATGCLFAFPTWEGPVDCVHTRCQIKRGELPRIALTNGILRSEGESGWLRFLDRKEKARVYRAYRAEARRTGVYDPWKMEAAMGMVYAGVGGMER